MFIRTRGIRSQMQRVEEIAVSRLNNHPEGVEVYISPANHNAYWVNVNWLQLNKLSDRYENFTNTPVSKL